MVRLVRSIAAAAMLTLSACAINPPPEVQIDNRCGFRRLALEVPLPGETPTASRSTFVEHVSSVYSRPAAQDVSDSLLFLSGGSQDGAFGAGFLHGWSIRRTADIEGRAARGLPPVRGLPKFRVVTGISTGAILSTWAFINQTAPLVNRYRIAREGDVLRAYASASSELSLGRAVARRGAVGDLSPLRQGLRDELTPDVMRAVAAGAREGRRLYVGVVDVDTGGAVAFDLTHMAERYADELRPERQMHYRNCYAEAIVASSSVPLAAPPTFIDNRMYIDGGARFGVFSEQIATLIDPGAELRPSGRTGHYYVIVNGTLRVVEQCGKVHEWDCGAAPDDLNGRRRPWRFHELARRSADILIDQTYRSSVERVIAAAEAANQAPFVDFIHRDVEDHLAEVTIPDLGSGRRTCRQWRAMDDSLDDPLEFHPRYMHCLVSYGEMRAGVTQWHLLE